MATVTAKPTHVKNRIIVGQGTVSHCVGIKLPSGAYVESTPYYNRQAQWEVYTAGGELVGTYAEVHLAVYHASLLTGNLIDMGCWDGPTEIDPAAAPVYPHAYDAVMLWCALAMHPLAQVNADFDL